MKKVYYDVLKDIEGRSFPRRSIVAPNRLEIRSKDLLFALFNATSSGTLFKLRKIIQDMTGKEIVIFAPSCRAGIAFMLSLLPQQDVVMPAYTCSVVKSAAQIARKNILYVDIGKNNINATSTEFEKQASPGRILIPTHLFGIQTDIETICELAKERHCITIEDAAAAFGARLNGKMLGTYGDVGIFSFERSKRLPAFRGAAIVINNERLFDPDKLAKYSLFETKSIIPLREIIFVILYNFATFPWLYGHVTLPLILNKYRQLEDSAELNHLESEINSPFYKRDFHPYQAALVLRMLKRLGKIKIKIAELVTIYDQILKDTDIITFVTKECDAGGVLRFPIAFPGRERKDILRNALARGLFLETNYDEPLPEKSEWDKYPNAKWAAQNVILLPLYTRLSPAQAEYVATEIKNILFGK
ncbi:MAG: DegT/DnrJ/EryC1/StrS family aminotransferase [bacterium]